MAVDQRRYYAEDRRIYDRQSADPDSVAWSTSRRMAKLIAAALNIYKVRRRKSAEKSK